LNGTRRVIAAIAAVFGALAIVPAAASAETVAMGSTLGHAAAPNGELCTNCLGVQRSQVGGNAPLPLTSPVNGTVTSWSVRTGDVGAVYNLRILTPTGAAYLGSGTSPDLTVPMGTTDSVLTNPVSVPIKLGDAIGVNVNVGHGLPSWPDNVSADVVGYATPPFADGASAGTTDIPGHELLLQATITFCRVPGVVGQTEAAAIAAIAAAGCTSTSTVQLLQLRGIKKGFSKKKKKRIRAANAALRANEGKVLGQSIAADATATPGTQVTLSVDHVVKPMKKKKKKH
jgi:hypothetical protein